MSATRLRYRRPALRSLPVPPNSLKLVTSSIRGTPQVSLSLQLQPRSGLGPVDVANSGGVLERTGGGAVRPGVGPQASGKLSVLLLQGGQARGAPVLDHDRSLPPRSGGNGRRPEGDHVASQKFRGPGRPQAGDMIAVSLRAGLVRSSTLQDHETSTPKVGACPPATRTRFRNLDRWPRPAGAASIALIRSMAPWSAPATRVGPLDVADESGLVCCGTQPVRGLVKTHPVSTEGRRREQDQHAAAQQPSHHQPYPDMAASEALL